MGNKQKSMLNGKERRKQIEEMLVTTFRTTVSLFKIRTKCVKFVDNANSHTFLSFIHISLSLCWCNIGCIKLFIRDKSIACHKMNNIFSILMSLIFCCLVLHVMMLY
jgi:hypothetical protein